MRQKNQTDQMINLFLRYLLKTPRIFIASFIERSLTLEIIISETMTIESLILISPTPPVHQKLKKIV